MKQQYGPWKVLEKKSKNVYKCQCTCGLIKRLSIDELEQIDDSTVCNHKIPNRKDLTGQTFGEWTVIKPTKGGYYLCRDNNNIEKEVYGTTLRNGRSKSSGVNTTAFKDLAGQEFGEWKVIKYVGNGYWECQCSCENKTIRNVHRYSLISGKSKSCGCKTVSIIQDTLIKNGINYTRTTEQIDAVSSKEKLEKFIQNLDNKPTINELSAKLGLNRASTGVYIHKYELEKLVDIKPKHSSIEKELINEIKNLDPNIDIQCGNREVLNGLELDIFIPSLNLAFEINGNYWHSTIYKDKYYHQNKTIACINKGIRLIQIFEYEWNDEETKQKLINIISRLIKQSSNKIYARETKIVILSKQDTDSFMEMYHLQGSTNSSINLGLTFKNELLAVMTFGTPRFNTNYEYELIRLAYKNDVDVIGGTEKLFRHFISNYKPASIISYCNISKFSGKVYEKLGFTQERISEPNYIWCDTHGKNVLTRYQTQKHKLLKLGLGTESQSEDDIMYELNYLKIYDSGNAVYTIRIK